MVQIQSFVALATALLPLFLSASTVSASIQQQQGNVGAHAAHQKLMHRRHHARANVTPFDAHAAGAASLKKKSSSSNKARRCKKRTSSSSSAKPVSTSAAAVPTKASQAQAPVNVAGDGDDDPKPSATSKAAAPAKATPSKSASSSSPPPKGGPSYLSGTQTGQGTYYNIDGGYTACGTEPSDSDYIAAVSHLLFDTYPGYSGGNPNNNPVCGKKATASYGGKSVTVTIQDRCVGCKITDLDLTPAAFNTIADPALGRIDITWHWD